MQPYEQQTPPTQPQYQPQPNQAPQYSQYPPAPQKKRKLPLIIGLIVGLLLLIGAAIASYFIFFFVSKDDYTQAKQPLATLNQKRSQFTSSSAFGEMNSPEAIKQYQDKAQAAVDEYEGIIRNLEKARATRDPEVATLVKTIAEKDRKSAKFYTDVLSDLAVYVPTILSCQSTGESTFQTAEQKIKALDTQKQTIDKCIGLIDEKLSGFKTEIMKELTEASKRYFVSISQEVENMQQAIKSNNSITQQSINQKFASLADQFTADAKTAEQKAANDLKQYDASDDARKLNTLLTQKAL